MKSIFKKVSTKYAFFLGIATLLFISISFLLTALLVYNSTEQLRRELTNRYSSIQSSTATDSLIANGDYLSNRLFNPLYNLDISALNEELNNIRNWLKPESILVLDKNKKIVSDGTDNNSDFGLQFPVPDELAIDNPLILEENNLRKLFFVIGYADEIAGYAYISFSKKNDKLLLNQLQSNLNMVWQKYTEGFTALIIAVLLIVLVFTVLLAWRFYLILSRPINEMKRAAEQFSLGNFQYKLPVTSNDEIGQLAGSMNRMAEELEHANLMLLRAQEISSFGSWEWHKEDNMFTISHGVYLIFGINRNDFSNTVEELVISISPTQHADFINLVKGQPRKTSSQEFDFTDSNNISKKLLLQREIIKNNEGEISKVSGTIQDITEQHLSEEKLRTLANYDTLTGLPNRNLFYDRLEQAINKVHRNNGNLALLFIDLDRFKSINDALGHDIGDQLLIDVAKRMNGKVRETDTLARMGGDEFTVILDGFVDEADPQIVARNILDVLSTPFIIDNRELNISASIGIALYPTDAKEMIGLIKNADAAMYVAKDMGKNMYHFFTPRLDQIARNKLEMEQKLRTAINNNEFEFFFQPQVDSQNNRIVAAESLLRWKVRDKYLSPAEFIPIMEESGLITRITEWALDEICRTSQYLKIKGIDDLRLSINLSASQFQQENLIELLDEAMLRHQVSPNQLEIEITESTLLDAESCRLNAGKLGARHIRLAIDDFGTGYSSLTYLKQYSVDVLKIDQSFVKDITYDSGDLEIVSAIISLAGSLKLDCVAEGVETAEQLDMLKEKGCQFIQGYNVCRPVPVEEFISWYKKHDRKDGVRSA